MKRIATDKPNSHRPEPAVNALWATLLGDDAVALVRDEILVAVDGEGETVVNPPTYAGGPREDSRYNLDRLSDGTCTVVLDSPQSQAQHLETVFGKDGYADLVPAVEVVIKSEGDGDVTSVRLLDMGHRLADAAIRFSTAGEAVKDAFAAFASRGDAVPIAKLGPTSLVFGVWDSRGTQGKVGRLLTSTVRAWDVVQLTRSAQYVPAYDYGLFEEFRPPSEADQKAAQEAGGEAPKLKKLSEQGLAAVPSTGKLGGVLVRGRIVRKQTLNLVALRHLRGVDDASGETLRSYVLGLALVSATHPSDHSYRSGCLLVPDPGKPSPWVLVRRDGSREVLDMPHGEILAMARVAAKAFGVGPGGTYEFRANLAKAALEKAPDDAKPAKPAKSVGGPRRGKGG